jgi:hypothetical protein
VADSDATNHTTPSVGNLTTFGPFNSATPSIIVANGSVLPVTSVGDTVVIVRMRIGEMALPSATSPPDALLCSKPSLAFTLNPTATTPLAATASLPAASDSYTPLSPLAPMFVYRGRPKEEWWRNVSSSPNSNVGPLPTRNLTASFRDVLLGI